MEVQLTDGEKIPMIVRVSPLIELDNRYQVLQSKLAREKPAKRFSSPKEVQVEPPEAVQVAKHVKQMSKGKTTSKKPHQEWRPKGTKEESKKGHKRELSPMEEDERRNPLKPFFP